MEASSNHRDGKFVNPLKVPMIAPGKTWEMIKKYTIVSRIDPKPETPLPVVPLEAGDWSEPEPEGLEFAWLGHSSLLIAVEGTKILVDPVLEKRASPFSWVGPKRFHPTPVTAEGLPPIDVVLITHDHYDHLEEGTVRTLASTAGLFLVPLGIGELLEDWGVAPQKIVELDWWESHTLGSLSFTATPALHYANRGLFDGNQRLWCSWSVRGSRRSFFVSGDSGWFDAFHQVGEKLGPFDLTFLKIGAYDELWKQIHMLPEEAVMEHEAVKGGQLVPLHWATFDLGLHPWYEPVERLVAEARKKNVSILTPGIGRKVDVDKPPKNDFWWRPFTQKPDQS